MNYARTASFIGIVVGVWDLICNLGDECELIWRHPFRDLNAVKILYIVTRYSPFLIHAASIIILHSMEKHLPSIPKQICLRWLAYTTVMSEWMLGLLVINLMLRVYALYNRSPYIILATIGLVAGKALNIGMCLHFFFPHHLFSPTCVPLNERPSALVIFSSIEIFIQGVPVYLTFTRSAQIAHSVRGTTRAALLTYLRRGGALSWGTITCVCVYAICKKNTVNEPQQAIFPLFIVLASIFGCHLILHLRKSTTSNGSGRTSPTPGELELDSVWDVETWPADPTESVVPPEFKDPNLSQPGPAKTTPPTQSDTKCQQR